MKTFNSFSRILWVFFLFIGLLITFRIIYTGSFDHIFMSWNIFLAWVPYMLSNNFAAVKTKPKWVQLILFATWLLFFPNALYIVTDLVHIEDNKDIPVWFDAVLLFASSFIGIMMAFISLRKTEFFLQNHFPKKAVTLLVPLILFTASFGVYLGRFQRWNSWDVIKSPISLVVEILGNFISPIQNYKAWAITVLFTGIYSLLYYFLKILPKAFEDEKNFL